LAPLKVTYSHLYLSCGVSYLEDNSVKYILNSTQILNLELNHKDNHIYE